MILWKSTAPTVKAAQKISPAITGDLEVDHIWPRSEGGTDAFENLAPLCTKCNRIKSDKMTMTGLQQYNRREGILLPENEVPPGNGARRKQ